MFSKRFAALFLAIMLILGIAGEAMASDDDFRVRVTVAPEKGGTVTGAGSYNYGEEVTLTAIPNEGYVFVKWTWSGSKPGSDPDPSLENQQSLTFEATRDIEFTCHFKKTSTYTASFDPNGGTGSVDDITGLSEGETVTLPGGEGLSREAYTFKGWSTAPDGPVISEYTMEASNVTFYAVWEKIPTYTASFDLNGGTGSVDDMTGLPEGETVTLPGGAGLLKEGYTFKGWSTASNGPVISEYTMEASNVTFYAVWEKIPTYTASFDLNGGTGSVDDITGLSEGETVTLPGGEGLSREGYTFKGWSTAPYGPVISEYTMEASNVTFYAVWEKIPTYTASFDINGGTGRVDDITGLSEGKTVILPDGAGLSRKGYKFKGWAFHNGKVIKGSFTMPDHDVTLFAVWVSDSAVEPPKSGDGIDLTGLNMMLGALELSAFMALRKRESESTK
ncbi:MAG: Internalin-A precursor [Firmicutes bacterium ADurb.Bin182]|nr:MAG: Internalin-A precursor [Firmicutes bacterium ADurb.Bin182]